ncbi:hypothetical protein [Escherichia coli]|uniref:hypothetical protein n=1 Tax=Escherichia coli TaxID=562 RepID=UPI0039A754EC
MDKQTINAVRSRARVGHPHHWWSCNEGGQPSPVLPVVYACPPVGGPVWPVTRNAFQTFSGLRRVVKTSCIDGCTVVWQYRGNQNGGQVRSNYAYTDENGTLRVRSMGAN